MFATIALATLPFLFQAPTAQVSYQQMLDVALPGSVVVFPEQPFDQIPTETLRIRKPLTIIGNNCVFRRIILDGPGSGELVLHELNATHVHWCQTNCHDVYELAPHRGFDGWISGSGFDSVRIYRSWIDGAIQVEVPETFLYQVTVDSLDNWPSAFTGDLFSFESYIEDVSNYYGGQHVTSLDAPRLRPVGVGSLAGSAQLGRTLEFDWTDLGYGILWASPGVRAPRRDLHDQHWIFLDDTPLFVKLGQRARVLIPRQRNLIGVEVTFQATDFGGRYSSPAFVLIHP